MDAVESIWAGRAIYAIVRPACRREPLHRTGTRSARSGGDPSLVEREGPRTQQDEGSLMKPPFAMMAVAGALVAPIALAQAPAQPTTNPARSGLRPMSAVPALSPTNPAGGVTNIPTTTPTD